jgi:4-hydroxybenzoate polyprenyltransferase
MEKIIAYLQVIRFHKTFRNTAPIVLFVIFLISGFEGLAAHRTEILQSVFLLGVLFYGGLYALNGWADIEEDRRIEYKRNRPLATGFFGPNAGLLIAVSQILGGFLLIYLYAKFLLPYTVALFVINFLYTFVFKKYDRIFACLILPLTQLIRVAIGLDIVNFWDPNFIWSFISIYLLMIAGHMQIQTTAGYLLRRRILNFQSYLLVASALIAIGGYFYTGQTLNLVPVPIAFIMLTLFRDWGRWEWIAKNVLVVSI